VGRKRVCSSDRERTYGSCGKEGGTALASQGGVWVEERERGSGQGCIWVGAMRKVISSEGQRRFYQLTLTREKTVTWRKEKKTTIKGRGKIKLWLFRSRHPRFQGQERSESEKKTGSSACS